MTLEELVRWQAESHKQRGHSCRAPEILKDLLLPDAKLRIPSGSDEALAKLKRMSRAARTRFVQAALQPPKPSHEARTLALVREELQPLLEAVQELSSHVTKLTEAVEKGSRLPRTLSNGTPKTTFQLPRMTLTDIHRRLQAEFGDYAGPTPYQIVEQVFAMGMEKEPWTSRSSTSGDIYYDADTFEVLRQFFMKHLEGLKIIEGATRLAHSP